MKTKRRLFQGLLLLGVFLICAPVLGLLGMAFGMARAFHAMSGAGIADPHELSQSIGLTLISTASGFILALIGVVLIVLSLIVLGSFERLTSPSLPPPFPLPQDKTPN